MEAPHWSQPVMKIRFAAILIGIIILTSVIGGILGGNNTEKFAVAGSTSPNEFLNNYTEALEVIQQQYFENIESDKLVYGSIKGMLRVLDPHSNFLDPKDFARLREDQHSKYYGLGIRVRPLLRDQGRHVIVEPPAIGTPAQKKGLRAGDVITKIEGEPIDDWSSDDVVSHLKGPKGTFVNITIERPGVRDPLIVKIERDEIPMVTVSYAFEIKPGIGYAKIDRFSEATADELIDKINKIKGMTGLILDLRDNPGGLLNQAIKISDFFLPQGALIVSTKGRAEGSERSYEAPGDKKINVPMVVIINKHSASASEIVAGALQDHDRALIVGESSFGKGLVQSVYTLANNTGMALTTAKYYTPSGRLIQRDYSGSNLEYYYLEMDSNENNPPKDREVRYTDSKRKVFGGGGITPDILEPAKDLNRFEMLLISKDVTFQYARRLSAGEGPNPDSFKMPVTAENKELTPRTVKNMPVYEINEEVLNDFKQFLKNRRIEFTDEEIKNNEEFIKRRIRQELFTSAFGIQEGFKIGIQGDSQILKALDVMPEAKILMTSGQITPLEQRTH
jgi:carboxyl-terminal processing protease